MDNETVSMLLRLPARLREDLRRGARESRRSLTAEVVHRLEQSIKADARRARRRHPDHHQRGGAP